MKEGSVTRVIVERFDSGMDVLESMEGLLQRHNVSAGSLTAIGAVKKAVVGYFTGEGKYSTVSIEGPLEILSCVGNVSLKEGLPFVHAHVTLADRQGRAYGGHLMPGCLVGATFEVTIHVYDDIKLSRTMDSATRLFLLET